MLTITHEYGEENSKTLKLLVSLYKNVFRITNDYSYVVFFFFNIVLPLIYLRVNLCGYTNECIIEFWRTHEHCSREAKFDGTFWLFYIYNKAPEGKFRISAVMTTNVT